MCNYIILLIHFVQFIKLNYFILDNIESHVESAGTHVEEANVQLAKASDYQVSVLGGYTGL